MAAQVVLDQCEFFQNLTLKDKINDVPDNTSSQSDGTSGCSVYNDGKDSITHGNQPSPRGRSTKRHRVDGSVSSEDITLSALQSECSCPGESPLTGLVGIVCEKWGEGPILHVKLTPTNPKESEPEATSTDLAGSGAEKYLTLANNVAKKEGKITSHSITCMIDSLYGLPNFFREDTVTDCLWTALYFGCEALEHECLKEIKSYINNENCVEWLLFSKLFELGNVSQEISEACLNVVRRNPSIEKLSIMDSFTALKILREDSCWYPNELFRAQQAEELFQIHRKILKDLFAKLEVGNPQMLQCIDIMFNDIHINDGTDPLPQVVDIHGTFEMQQNAGWAASYDKELDLELREYVCANFDGGKCPSKGYQELIGYFLKKVDDLPELDDSAEDIVNKIGTVLLNPTKCFQSVTSKRSSRRPLVANKEEATEENFYIDDMPTPCHYGATDYPQEWWNDESFQQSKHIPIEQFTAYTFEARPPVAFSLKRCLWLLRSVAVQCLNGLLLVNMTRQELESFAHGDLLSSHSVEAICERKTKLQKKMEYAANLGVETYEELDGLDDVPAEIMETTVPYFRFGIQINGIFEGKIGNDSSNGCLASYNSECEEFAGCLWSMEVTRRLDEEDGQTLSMHLRRKSSVGRMMSYTEPRNKVKFKFGVRAFTGVGM